MVGPSVYSGIYIGVWSYSALLTGHFLIWNQSRSLHFKYNIFPPSSTFLPSICGKTSQFLFFSAGATVYFTQPSLRWVTIPHMARFSSPGRFLSTSWLLVQPWLCTPASLQFCNSLGRLLFMVGASLYFAPSLQQLALSGLNAIFQMRSILVATVFNSRAPFVVCFANYNCLVLNVES